MKAALHIEDLVITCVTIVKTDFNFLNFICIARDPFALLRGKADGFSSFICFN